MNRKELEEIYKLAQALCKKTAKYLRSCSNCKYNVSDIDTMEAVCDRCNDDYDKWELEVEV